MWHFNPKQLTLSPCQGWRGGKAQLKRLRVSSKCESMKGTKKSTMGLAFLLSLYSLLREYFLLLMSLITTSCICHLLRPQPSVALHVRLPWGSMGTLCSVTEPADVNRCASIYTRLESGPWGTRSSHSSGQFL